MLCFRCGAAGVLLDLSKEWASCAYLLADFKSVTINVVFTHLSV